MLEEEVDGAGDDETGKADPFHRNRLMSCRVFGDGSTQSAANIGFLHGDKRTGFTGSGRQRIFVERIEGCHVQNAGRDAFTPQLFRSLYREMHDRILVMANGRLTGDFPAGAAAAEVISAATPNLNKVKSS
jgi:hypothetical protein